jgi:hypothetical protein
MKVITVINDKNNLGFNLLTLSCALNNLELVVLVSRQMHFSSNRIKDELLKEYLKNNTDDDETILFTDGNDAVLMATEEEIKVKLVKTGRDLVFSTESGCWPDTNLASQYPEQGSSPYKYLNSGGFIGKSGLIREFLDDESYDLYNFRKSNQYLWAKRYLKYPDKIGLDTSCEIFQTFSPEVGNAHLPKGTSANVSEFIPYYKCMKQWFGSNFQIQDGRLFSSITQTWPCHAHFNGYSKWLIDHDIIAMIFGKCSEFRQPQFLYEED